VFVKVNKKVIDNYKDTNLEHIRIY